MLDSYRPETAFDTFVPLGESVQSSRPTSEKLRGIGENYSPDAQIQRINRKLRRRVKTPMPSFPSEDGQSVLLDNLVASGQNLRRLDGLPRPDSGQTAS